MEDDARTEDRPPAPLVAGDIDGDRLWKHLEESCAWARHARPAGAEEALRYVMSRLGAWGVAATVHECDVYAPPSEAHPEGDWRRLRFPVANVAPDGGSALFVLVGGHGDASLLELARVFHLRRNELKHGLRIAWWNGGGEIGFGAAAGYADSHFDLLRSRCLSYLNVDRLADRTLTRYRPCATAELADWVRDVLRRRAGQEADPTPLPGDADASFLGVGLPSFSFLPVSGARDVGEMGRDRLTAHTAFYAEALYELAARERAPLDLMAVADVFWGELEVLSGETGDAFDLGQVKEAVKELVVVLEDHEEEHAGLEPGVFNRKMLDICHLINPVLYTERGPYGHDPGGSGGVLPTLRRARRLAGLDPEGPEARRLRAQLVRARTRVCDMTSRAILVART
ncbi:MAG: hypothetical protein ACE5IM_00885 [Nitrospinota bacterium]